MLSKNTLALLGMVAGGLAVWGWLHRAPAISPEMAAACEGPPLRTAQAMDDALTRGDPIHPVYRCVDKAALASARSRETPARGYTVREPARPNTPSAKPTLSVARRGFVTQLALPASPAEPLPSPPPSLYVRMTYTTSEGWVMPAFVSADPGDGRRHPAIVWLTGGDTNSLGDFWTPGPRTNDQSASALRQAGVTVMFPVLRGGNTAPGRKQAFWGEVDDVLAAAEALAKLPQVDPEHIYLGGHSTGGTLALLVSEASSRFKGVLALGPVAELSDYGSNVWPVAWATLRTEELYLRSPIHWLHGITRPTYIVEGGLRGNTASQKALCDAAASNPQVHCAQLEGLDHFSVIDVAARLMAARMTQAHLAAGTPQGEFSLSFPGEQTR